MWRNPTKGVMPAEQKADIGVNEGTLIDNQILL